MMKLQVNVEIMIKMKNKTLMIVYFAIAFIGVAGCGLNIQKTESKINVLSLAEMQLALIDTIFFQSTMVIPLETNDSTFIQNINRICLSNDTLFVLDSKLGKVVMFDMEGRCVGKIHNVGNGPREYIQISDICIHPLKKTIVLLCSQPYKIMYYTYLGEFIEEATYSDFYSEFFIQGDTLYCYDSGVMGKKKLGVFIYPMEWKKNIDLETGLFFDAESKGESYCFSKGKRMTVSSDMTFTWPFDYSIYSVRDGEIYEKYKIDLKEHQVPKSIFNANLSPLDFIDLCDEKKYLYTIENVVENSDYLLFGTNKDIFVYDKDMYKLTGYSFIVNTVLQEGKVNYLSLNHPNLIVQVWQPSVFKRCINRRKERDGNLEKIDKQYLQVYESIVEEDNPILVIYELPHRN